MAEGTLNALKRENSGKQIAKHLRLQGIVPGVLYGREIDSTALSIERHDLVALLHSAGRNAVVNLMIDKAKQEVKSFIYDIQHDPITGDIIHVDLKQISMKEKINVTVPVHLEGIPVGVKNEGGTVEQAMHTIDISCLPGNIPSEFSVDISAMNIGDAIHIKDLKLDDFDILTDEESLVVHVIAPRLHEEGVDEELEDLEGASMEPEVIGHKSEEEGE